MKSASPELIAFLNSSQQFCIADLFAITLLDGTLLRLTSADMDIGEFSSSGPILRRSRIRNRIGLEVDDLDVTVIASPGHEINGVPWVVAARVGVLDGAQLALHRIYMPTWGDTSLGTVPLFDGRVADVDIEGLEISLTIKSVLEVLDTKIPRNVYQPSCIHSIYDAGCGLDAAAFTTALAVDDGAGTPTRTQVPLSMHARAAGYWELGRCEFTSGANAGLRRAIKAHPTTNMITVMPPLPYVPADSDGLALIPACSGIESLCDTRLSNKLRFRGYPYIPVAEMAT